MNVLRFQKEFTFLGEHFQLKAMVRNFAGHFTCALCENDAEKLEYLDDLCETSYFFSNLELLHQRFPGRWFFGVHVRTENNESLLTAVDDFGKQYHRTENDNGLATEKYHSDFEGFKSDQLLETCKEHL